MDNGLSWFENLFPQLFVGGDVAVRFLLKLLLIMAITGLAIVGIYRLTNWLKEKYLMSSLQDGPNKAKIASIMGEIFFFTCLVIVIVSAIHFLGFEIGLFLAAMAFGFGFAFQDILGNGLAGIMILTNNDYKLGDIIEVDHDNKDYFGRIEELTIRYVILRTVDLRRVVVPNLVMVMYPVRTYEIEDSIRYDIPFTVQYTSSVSEVIELTTKAIHGSDIVNRPDQTICLLQAMGDHGLEFLVYVYVDPRCGLTKKRIIGALTQAIYTSLEQHDIVIAYPHRAITTDLDNGILSDIVMGMGVV